LVIDGTARHSLAAAAAVGGYFEVETDGEVLADPRWRGFTDLLDDPSVLAGRIEFVRATLSERTGHELAQIDLRACGSTHFLGLASRLIAPALATVALHGLVIACDSTDLRWQPVDGGPVPIGFASASVHDASDCDTAASLLHVHVVDPLINPLVEAFRGVSPIVLWGNVASAVAGAAGMLAGSGVVCALDPVTVAAATLARGPLAGTGTFDAPDRFFRRSSCCLYYRLPGGVICGDCVLA
jgi:ferric iron reductase protein FhuF